MSFLNIAIGSIGAGLIGAKASKDAANTQAKAAGKAGDLNWKIFDTINQQQEPYREAGYGALDELQTLLGIGKAPVAPNRDDFLNNKSSPNRFKGWEEFDQTGFDQATAQYNQDLEAFNSKKSDPRYGSLMHQFNAQDLTKGLAPNYDFMLQQGQGATNALANKSGGLISGNALTGIDRFTQGFAGNAYQQAFDNFTSNQTNIFNRLSSIAGIGQTANQQTAGAAQNAGTNIGNAYMAAGQANAAGTVGAANAVSGAINNVGSWYAIKDMIK